jgi:transposase
MEDTTMATLVAANGAITNPLYVGIDLHKDTLMACVINQSTGEISFERIACKCRDRIVTYFTQLRQTAPLRVAIEAVGFYRWLWDLLEPLVDELLLADATQCRALAGRRLKTDREDAENVATLLSMGRLPIAYAPCREERELRDCTRHRHFLRRQNSRCLHRVRGIMNLNNRPGPKELAADALIRYLKGQEALLSEQHRRQLWQAVEQLVLLERQVPEAEREMDRLLKQDSFRAKAELLRTIPGVGPIVTATVLAEVGDFGRFPDGKAIARYAGLSPTVYASGDKCRTGHICKAGPTDLRWVLQQAAWVAIRCDARVKKLYLRLRRRCDSKRAAVAIARKLLTWMHAMVRKNQAYQGEKVAA